MIDFKAIEKCVKEAGQIVLAADLENASVEKKTGDANFCTEYDVKVQKFLIDELSKILPEASFFGEEETSNNIQNFIDSYGMQSYQSVVNNEPFLTTRPNCRHSLRPVVLEDALKYTDKKESCKAAVLFSI